MLSDPKILGRLKKVRRTGFVGPYERKGLYSVKEVHAKIGLSPIDFDGDLIKMDSSRYRLFNDKGCVCVRCGVQGLFYAKERSARFDKATRTHQPTTNPWHFNLYGLAANGKAVLMTKDHIMPRSKGGPDHHDNYQPMCSPCNTKKGATVLEEAA